LLVNPTGSKLWRMDYRHLSKRRTLAVGTYPTLSLADARSRREDAKKHLANGLDPVEQKQVARLAAKAAAENTFTLIADEWLDKVESDGLSKPTMDKNRWLIGLAKESFGSKPFMGPNKITAADVLVALRKLEKRGRHDSAMTMRATIGRVFRYAIVTSRAERDVTVDLRGALISPKRTHRAAILDPDKLGGLLRAIDGYDGQRSTALALELAPHVFLRPKEIRFAEWSELKKLDHNDPQWRIPGERMKMKRDHIIPLSWQAVAILRKLREITGDGRYLFPSVRTTKKPISENTLNAAFRRMGYSKTEVTAHGLRRTASTMLNEKRSSQGFESDWIERQLAHVEQNEVRGAYNAAEWIDDRRKMMQWWSDYLDNLRDAAAISNADDVAELLG